MLMTASGHRGFSEKSVRDGLQIRSISCPCTKKKENHASVLFPLNSGVTHTLLQNSTGQTYTEKHVDTHQGKARYL